MCDVILPELCVSEGTGNIVGPAQILQSGHRLYNALHLLTTILFQEYHTPQSQRGIAVPHLTNSHPIILSPSYVSKNWTEQTVTPVRSCKCKFLGFIARHIRHTPPLKYKYINPSWLRGIMNILGLSPRLQNMSMLKANQVFAILTLIMLWIKANQVFAILMLIML